jgi:hypothetical protein
MEAVMTPTLARTTAPPFVFLRDQIPLSQTEFRRALYCRDWAQRLLDQRADYIRHHALDPNIHLPRANWDLEADLHEPVRRVFKGQYEVLNFLRLFSEMFTGYHLSRLDRGNGRPHLLEVPTDLDDFLAERAAEPDDYTRLYAHCLPRMSPFLRVEPPMAFGEVGWLIDGRIVNHDTYVYLERLVLLAESGKLGDLIFSRSPRVVEIGGGFGGLAYHLRRLVPQARYFIVDIPESLLFSSIYLTRFFPSADNVLLTPDNLEELQRTGPGFTFVPNYLFGALVSSGLPFDLAINTLSMSEMSESQVRCYGSGLKTLLGEQGAFFEQNQDNRCIGLLNASSYIGDYFEHVRTLTSTVVPLTQGKAHLWSSRPYQSSRRRIDWFRPQRVLKRVRSGTARPTTMNTAYFWYLGLSKRLGWKQS